MRDYIDFDNNLECRKNEENDDIPIPENNEESSDDDEEIPKPSNADVETAFETLKNYSLTNNVPELFSEYLKHLKSHYFQVKRKQRQTTINDFFLE